MPNSHSVHLDVRALCALALAAALAFGAALALGACSGSGDEGVGRGTVLAVDAAAGLVTIDHGDIPGLMKGMTMTFEVADPALLSGVASGQQVEFRVRHEEGRYVVQEIAAKP
jgi:Cu/Ag efflux protein CusF